MKTVIKKLPVIRTIARAVYFALVSPFRSFPGSDEYWKQRYRSGGASGAGSSRKLAEFKAEVLNGFVADRQIKTVAEYGCGDGGQLRLSKYPSYVGFDVSPEAISQCKNIFANDETKTFKLIEEYADERAELTLSLDVIFHLTEEDVFLAHMERLFGSSERFVIIYSSNTDKQARFQAPHVRHREFTKWVERRPEWRLMQHVPNRYPYAGDEQVGSFADFYIYEKT